MTGASGRLGRLLRAVWSAEGPPAGAITWLPRPGADGGWITAEWPRGAQILHLAGVTRGTKAELDANERLAAALARAARETGAARVLFASTVAVYRPGTGALAETDPPQPQTDYGRSKLQAEQRLAKDLAGSGAGLTILRIANVAGADALLGGALARPGQPVTLDPVPGRSGGPERSYIGPLTLARALAALIRSATAWPEVLNLAQPGAVDMADLLAALGADWGFGPPRAGVVPRVEVDVARLMAVHPLGRATPAGLVDEVRSLQGTWP